MILELDDFSSFSGAVDKLQGDKVEGAIAIVFFNKLESESAEEIKKIEKKLEEKRLEKRLINKAILNINQHLELELPTVITYLGETYIIGNELKIKKAKNVFKQS